MTDDSAATLVAAEDRVARPSLVAGVGVSAPSLRSLETLFALMPHGTGAAFVVVSQSEKPVQSAMLLRAMSQQNGLRVTLAEDGQLLEPETCYAVPSGMMALFDDGRLRLEAPEQEAGHRGTVDTFLISLAETQRERAVAIILAELGGAGGIGLARIKECGGLGVAEESEGMSRPSPLEVGGAAGLADSVIPLAQIAQRLAQHAGHLAEASRPAEVEYLFDGGEERIPEIADILRNGTGHDFHGYKHNTFLRRIQRRMQVVRLDTLDEYVERLHADAAEVQALFQDLLIGVTQFFRDPAEFELLEQLVLPGLLKDKGAGDTVRVWVLGCATGEEAYSICMLIRDALAGRDGVPQVQVFGTDIDARSLAIARAGRYPQSIENHISPERLARWFTQEGGTWCVHKDLREMCIFSAHNVIKDAPFSRIDLISCRNLLIYLNSDVQDRVIPLFHFSLRAGGHLFLGPSENITRHAKLFQPVDRRHRIFVRQETTTPMLSGFPLTRWRDPKRLVEGEPPRPVRTPLANALTKQAEKVAERYAPAYVLVDDDYDVISFSNGMGKFLDPIGGTANLNLMNLVHRDLRPDVRAGLHRSVGERNAQRLNPVRLGAGESARTVSIIIEPLQTAADEPSRFVVLFHDEGTHGAVPVASGLSDPAMLRDEQVLRLEEELRLTKDRLQATVEELESTNEELKSSNEEYQSINEELQSTNEELETSKEELQSVNEELQTVNGELAFRVTDLARSNSDLKNLLEATQIATLFLDNELRIKSFTPTITDVLHIMETDVGRPVHHIAPRVPYPELVDDVRRVLRTLAIVERVIGPAKGPRISVRVLPYRSLDNFIAGTVLTFLDVTESTRAQEALRVAQERMRLANANADIVTWEMSIPGGRFAFPEDASRTLDVPLPPTLDALLGLLHPEDGPDVAAAFAGVIEGSERLDVECRVRAGAGVRWLRVTAGRGDDCLVGVFQDISARQQAEGQRMLLLGELQHRVKNILAVVRSMWQRTKEGATSLEEFHTHFLGRIEALARAQKLLASRGVDGIHLDELVRDELAASLGAQGEDRDIGGPDILLKDKAAESFALALHELATNAVKYGALSTPNGRLSVRWRTMNTSVGRRLSLEWRESGVAVVDPEPRRFGFGRELIEQGLPYNLGATTSLEFAAGGVRCMLELPIGDRVLEVPEEEDAE